MFILGLTGGIATGKSTVSRIIRNLDIPIIDADLIAREVVLPGTQGYNRVVEQFHSPQQGILSPDGTLDRSKLGNVIFADPAQRQKLNSILHPLIRRRMAYLTFYYYITAHPLIVLDVPLLFESNLDRFTSKTAVVYCPKDLQEARLISRDNCDLESARQRIAAQLDMDVKRSRADYIIDNSGDLENTRIQILDLVSKITPSRFFTLIYMLPLVIALFGLKWTAQFILKFLL